MAGGRLQWRDVNFNPGRGVSDIIQASDAMQRSFAGLGDTLIGIGDKRRELALLAEQDVAAQAQGQAYASLLGQVGNQQGMQDLVRSGAGLDAKHITSDIFKDFQAAHKNAIADELGFHQTERTQRHDNASDAAAYFQAAAQEAFSRGDVQAGRVYNNQALSVLGEAGQVNVDKFNTSVDGSRDRFTTNFNAQESNRRANAQDARAAESHGWARTNHQNALSDRAAQHRIANAIASAMQGAVDQESSLAVVRQLVAGMEPRHQEIAHTMLRDNPQWATPTGYTQQGQGQGQTGGQSAPVGSVGDTSATHDLRVADATSTDIPNARYYALANDKRELHEVVADLKGTNTPLEKMAGADLQRAYQVFKQGDPNATPAQFVHAINESPEVYGTRNILERMLGGFGNLTGSSVDTEDTSGFFSLHGKNFIDLNKLQQESARLRDGLPEFLDTRETRNQEKNMALELQRKQQEILDRQQRQQEVARQRGIDLTAEPYAQYLGGQQAQADAYKQLAQELSHNFRMRNASVTSPVPDGGYVSPNTFREQYEDLRNTELKNTSNQMFHQGFKTNEAYQQMKQLQESVEYFENAVKTDNRPHIANHLKDLKKRLAAAERKFEREDQAHNAIIDKLRERQQERSK